MGSFSFYIVSASDFVALYVQSSDGSGSHSGHSSQSGHSGSGHHSPEPVEGAASEAVATEAQGAKAKTAEAEKVDPAPLPSTEVVFPAAVAGRKGKKRSGSQGSR